MSSETGFFRQDRLIIGLLVGACVPFAAYGILLTGVDFIDTHLLGPDTTVSRAFRERTLSVIAICANLIPLHYYRNKYFDNTMRGLVFPTIAYVGIWFWLFGQQLLGL